MRNSILLYGANCSGKTSLTEEFKNVAKVIHTDELYRTLVREYRTKKGIVETEKLGIFTDRQKFELIKRLEEFENVIIEGKKFFNEDVFNFCNSYYFDVLHIIILVYDYLVIAKKFSACNKNYSEYYFDKEIAEYECKGRFEAIYESLCHKTKNIALFDVSDGLNSVRSYVKKILEIDMKGKDKMNTEELDVKVIEELEELTEQKKELDSQIKILWKRLRKGEDVSEELYKMRKKRRKTREKIKKILRGGGG